MLEPTRSRYLAALGVDVYLPRFMLPGARDSGACEWDEVALPEISAPLLPAIDLPVEKAPVPSRRALPAIEEAPSAVASAVPARAEAEVPQFALSVVAAANGVLLLDDAPSSNAERSEYQRLLGNFLSAVNKDPHFALDTFFWPLRKSSPITQDATAAKETLAAYLHKQIQQRGIHTILLLGVVAQQWVEIDQPELRCIRSNSLLACLRDPSLKRQLWADVRSLSVR